MLLGQVHPRKLIGTRSVSIGNARMQPRFVRSGAVAVAVVVIPPLIWRGLGIALRRVLPFLLATQRGQVEVAPGAAHHLVAASVDEISAKYMFAVADEGIGAVPLGYIEVGVEFVGQRVPRDRLPAHPGL